MSEAALHDRKILLAINSAECAGVAAHYLRMFGDYADLGDKAGMRYSLKSAVEHVKVAVASFKDFEALEHPIAEISGATE